jgi:hypothetical protein
LFTENSANKIGRITTAGIFTEYPIPTASSGPIGITPGPDGAVWFTENSAVKIGRINSAGIFSEFVLPTVLNGPTEITTGPDGALWFVALSTNRIGRMTTSGVFTAYLLPGVSAHPGAIITGPDSALWFIELTGELGRLTTTGVINQYPTPGSSPRGITTGPDHALWFTDFLGNDVGRAAIPVTASVTISAASLPAGQIGFSYLTALSASGGTAPYSNWTVVSGSLPTGLTLAPSTGGISGIPTGVASGAFSFSVTVQDSTGVTSPAQSFSIAITQTGCAYLLGSSGQAFAPVGGAGSIAVTAGVGCAWAVSGAPAWVTITSGASGTGNGTVNYTVATNGTLSALSATLTIASLPFTVQEQAGTGLSFIGSMPHLAAEGGWNTTFTLVNKGTTSVQAQVNLSDDNGNSLALPLSFPQQPAEGPVTEASVNQIVAANASYLVEASGSATVPFVEGSAQLDATGAVDGFAIFHFNPSQQEAVVPLETRNASSYVLAFDNTNSVLTGVAVANVSAIPASIPVIIRNDSGSEVTTAFLTLPGNGHTSFVLSTQYPSTANIRGTVEIDTPGFGTASAAQISVLGIRYTPPGTLTTIPALANVGTTGGLMAHLASSNGWQTTFVLVNTSASAAQAQLNFYGDNGIPLALPLTFPQGTIAAQTASSVSQSIAAYSSLWVQSTGPLGAVIQLGSAQLTTTGNVSGLAIFRYNPNGQEAVVPLESRDASAYLLAFDNTNGTATGMAISIASSQAVNVPVVIRDDTGAPLATGTIPLAPNGHYSQVLTTVFPVTANIRGTVEFDQPSGGPFGFTPIPGPISVLGIRSPPALTFTTLPALAK